MFLEVPSPPPARRASGRRRAIKNSLAISFNISQMRGHSGIVRYALLRVHREPVAEEKLALLHRKCGKPSRFRLRLYTQKGVGKNGREVYSLSAVKTLPTANLSQEEWVEFQDITKMYTSVVQDMQERLGENETHITKVVQVRLELSSPSCRFISPSELGFSSTAENKAQLVGLEETTIGKDLSFSRVMTAIAKQQHFLRRSRRQAEPEGVAPVSTETTGSVQLVTESPSTDNTNSTETTGPVSTSSPRTDSPTPARTDSPTPARTDSPTPATPDEYLNKRCKLYYYTVSFAYHAWDIHIQHKF